MKIWIPQTDPQWAQAKDLPGRDTKTGKWVEKKDLQSSPPSAPQKLDAVPPENWPAWAKWVAQSRWACDAGVGDTIHRELGKAGEFFKNALKAAGLECGCDARREQYNQLYPYAKGAR